MSNRKDRQENLPETQSAEEIQDSKTKRSKKQKGPQAHAEGAHGEKTHNALIEQLESGKAAISRERYVERTRDRGERRLVEEREQHDEAELNSEKTRLSRQLDEENKTREGYPVVGGHGSKSLGDTPQSK